MVDIYLLGRFAVTVDGIPLSGEAAQKRRLALLPVLAGTDLRPITRDRVIGVLWPDHDTDSARHLLSAGVHVLRRALGADAIISHGDELALNPALVTVDAIAFRNAVAAGEDEAALRLYEGPFLDGFHVSGAADFEQWADAERTELAHLYALVLERAGAARAARGDAQAALQAWRKRAALDPYDAHVAIGLMQAMTAAGQRAAAIRHAQVHAVLLAEELGAAPDPAVTAYAAELRATAGNGVSEPAVPGNGPVPAAETVTPDAAPAREASAPAAQATAPPVPTLALPTPPRRRLRAPLLRVGIVVFVLAMLGVLALFARPRPIVPNELGGVRRIAVVPLRADAAQQHWAEGLAEVMIYELRRINGLEVLSRDVSFPYAGRDPATTIRELGVDALFIGDLKVDEAGYWIGVELIDARGLAIFSDDFHQAEARALLHPVALAIAGRLQRTLQPENPVTRSADLARDDAYETWVHARLAWSRRTPAALDTALTLFRAATALDSTYALAWVGIADALNMMASYDYGAVAPDSAYPQAEAAARRALQLDPQLAPAHAALANVAANYRWNWKAAEQGYERALELDPHLTSAHQWLSLLLAARGRFDEAVQHARAATEAEPTSAIASVNYAHVLYYRRDYAGARLRTRQALRADPTFNRGHVLAALIDLAEFDMDAALGRLQQLRQAAGDEPVLIALLATAHARRGEVRPARALLRELESLRRTRYVPAELLALVHVSLGERSPALAELREALRLRSGGVTYLAVEPLLDPIRQDPQFVAFAREAEDAGAAGAR